MAPEKPNKRNASLQAAEAVRLAQARVWEDRALQLKAQHYTRTQIAEIIKTEGGTITSESGVRAAIDRALGKRNPRADVVLADENSKLDEVEARAARIYFDDDEPREEVWKAGMMLARTAAIRARINGLHTTRVIVEDYTADSLNRELAALTAGAAIGRTLTADAADQ